MVGFVRFVISVVKKYFIGTFLWIYEADKGQGSNFPGLLTR